MTSKYSRNSLAKKILNLYKDKHKFIYISWNGWSGKSSFSKLVIELWKEQWISINHIDTDDFLINSQLRKSAKKERIDNNNKKRISNYTSAFEESYNLAQLDSIIYSLEQQTDCFYKSKYDNKYIKVDHIHPLTIIEWIGTVFLEKNRNALSIWISCNEETEIQRRLKRARNGEREINYEELQQKTKERNEQLKATTLHHLSKFDIILDSSNDDILIVNKDNTNNL